MNFVRLLPVILSFLLLAAHFLRSGEQLYIAVLMILLVLLFIREHWVPWVIQAVLLLGALEWVLTLTNFARMRMEFGMPWMRMALILGAVALFTAASGLVFRNKALKARYSRGKETE